MTSAAARPRASGHVDSRSVGGFAIAAGIVDAVCVVAFVLFYAIETGRPGQHLFGPISDGTTALFDLLLLPVLWFAAQRLPVATPGRVYALITIVATTIGFLNSALLVLRLMNEAVSFMLSLLVIAVQAGWFVLMGRRGDRALSLSRGLSRWALVIGLGILAAMVLLVPAALLPATSPVAAVLWIVGTLVGGLAWLSWPAWFIVVGVRLRQSPSSVDGRVL